MGTISHASNRTYFRWQRLLMGIAAVTLSLKSIFACGKTAVKVSDTSCSDAKLIFYLRIAFLHLKDCRHHFGHTKAFAFYRCSLSVKYHKFRNICSYFFLTLYWFMDFWGFLNWNEYLRPSTHQGALEQRILLLCYSCVAAMFSNSTFKIIFLWLIVRCGYA